MKFTSEDLMKAMGLQVGDRVKVNEREYVFEVINNGLFIRLRSEDEEYPLFYLFTSKQQAETYITTGNYPMNLKYEIRKVKVVLQVIE